MEHDRSRSRRPAHILIVIGAIIAFMVVVTFVGYNIYHAKTMQQEMTRSLD